MVFARLFRYGCPLLALLTVLLPGIGWAQFREASPPQRLSTGQTTNLFATWRGADALDGFVVKLPPGWTFRKARVLRYGYERVSLKNQEETSSGIVVTLPKTLHAPFDLILQVQTGPSPGLYQWSVTPFNVQRNDENEFLPQTANRLTQHLRTRTPAHAPASNYALSFSDGATVSLPRRRLPPLDDKHPYTIAFWMRTHSLGAALLSTWKGEEEQPYPVEAVVTQDGRLSLYRGRRGLHRSLTTKDPVADSQWHHVAVTHSPKQPQLTLYLDGTAVDSLRPRALPYVPDTPFVLGGRPDTPLPKTKESLSSYVGLIDELRVAASVFPASRVRSLSQQAPTDSRPTSQGGVFLSFDADHLSPLLSNTRTDARRVRAHRDVKPPVSNLHAQVSGREVELIWQSARRPQRATFLIERSVDGRTFDTVGRLSARNARARTPQGAWQFRFGDTQAPDQNVLYYRIRRVNNENKELSRILKVGRGTSPAEEKLLMGNSPNPFSTRTKIAYHLVKERRVQLSVWDLSGHRIRGLVDDVKPAGYHEVTFQPNQLPSGTYFARIRTPSRSESLKMTLIR